MSTVMQNVPLANVQYSSHLFAGGQKVHSPLFKNTHKKMTGYSKEVIMQY